MDWIKIPIDEILFSDYTNSEILALIKYQAVYSQLEKEPTKKQLRRFLSPRELTFVLNSYEVCIELVQKQIQMVQQKRNKEKESYQQKQVLNEKPVYGTNADRISSGRADKTRLDKTREDKEYKEKFENWYKYYPKKVGRGSAETSFKSALKKANVELIISGLKSYNEYLAKHPEKQDYIMNPATWLNQECWLDELDAPSACSASEEIPAAFKLPRLEGESTLEHFKRRSEAARNEKNNKAN